MALGTNAAGEACTGQIVGQSATVYCGTWRQPSAHAESIAPAGSGDPATIATASPWRAALDARFACGAPSATTILNGEPAFVLSCARQIGGWPNVALVTRIGDRIWVADGIVPAAPAMERALGIASGRLTAQAAPADPGSAALMANRLAARAFGSSDVGLSDELMIRGALANQVGNPVAAETAYRAALAVQQKAFGPNDPRTSVTITRLALQLSNEGRFTEAEQLFHQADQLAPRNTADPLAMPLLLQYRAMNDIQQKQPQAALPLLAKAEAGFAAVVPTSGLQAQPPPPRTVNPFVTNTLSRLAPLLNPGEVLRNPMEDAAIDHLIEVRRYRAVALQALGRTRESQAALASAVALDRSTRRAGSVEAARLARDSGVFAAASGSSVQAVSDLTASETDFRHHLPDSKPVIVTALLRVAELVHAGDAHAALAICRLAAEGLARLKEGVAPDLLAPCLDVYAAEAARDPQHAQPIREEMFLTAQLAQGNETVQQIALATVRLQENARDPKIAAAMRRYQDAFERQRALEQRRDALAGSAAPGDTQPEVAALDKQIDAAQQAVADADVALQSAAPNYNQLVQRVVAAKDVYAVLPPGEAFAAITVEQSGGWVFLLHGGRMDVARLGADGGQIEGLVKRVRASVEPGSAGLPRFDVADAQALFAATLGPVRAGLAGMTSLTVAPTGALLALPFEVLLTGPADPSQLGSAPFLVREMAIAHVPSAGNFVSLRRAAGGSRAGAPWFGFGDFRPVTLAEAERTYPAAECGDSARLIANLPPLPGAARELEVARQILGADKSDELLGPAFTAAAVERMPLANYRVLHFATHAVLPTDLACQQEPAIITSPPSGATDASGALLTSEAIVRLKLDADAIILSACDTGGLGGSLAGESLSDLARSFFFAGARSLLVTHWAVSDQVGAYLVADTLRRFRADPGAGLSGALREAQLALLSEAGTSLPAEVVHPFYWAPFAVIGVSGGGARNSNRVAVVE